METYKKRQMLLNQLKTGAKDMDNQTVLEIAIEIAIEIAMLDDKLKKDTISK